jgi:hypothetical protein
VSSQEDLEKLREELVTADPATVVANHAYGLFELASLYLSSKPPRVEAASLAIDAMAGLIDATEDRLGSNAEALREGLRQIQLAFIEVSKLANSDAQQSSGTGTGFTSPEPASQPADHTDGKPDQ